MRLAGGVFGNVSGSNITEYMAVTTPTDPFCRTQAGALRCLLIVERVSKIPTEKVCPLSTS